MKDGMRVFHCQDEGRMNNSFCMHSETWNWKVELVLLDVGIDHDGAARGGLHAIEAQLQGLRTRLF